MKSFIAIPIILASAGAFAGVVSHSADPRALSGGETTVVAANKNAFASPAANLPVEDLRTFASGNRLFNTNWVQAPASVEHLDGLGPVFNRVSCSGCHLRDGRGQPPEREGDAMMSMLVRLSVPGRSERGDVKPHPAYGDQLNDRAIQGVPAEGRAVVSYKEVKRQFDDGETYSLAVPTYTFKDLAFGPLGDDVMFSPRVAPHMVGLGLLEAIPAKAIEALADPDDKDGDGVSGRTNRVWHPQRREMKIGRFGWKANQATLELQNAGAARGDIGLTSSLFPEENVTSVQTAARAAAKGKDVDLSDEDLHRLTFYTRVLAVPVRRDVDDPIVRKGEALFETAGCATCHTRAHRTGDSDIKALANQTIHPYTDLLLHDMGDELADGRPDWDATGKEWRTPPLWGIGLFKVVNGHTRYLHDGRARNMIEAIMWHGGEAEGSREKVRKMTKEERDALVRFLESL